MSIDTTTPDPTKNSVSTAMNSQATTAALKALRTSLITFAATMFTVLVLWVGTIQLFDLSPFIAKTPADVWQYLFTEPDSAADRAELMSKLGETLVDAAVGFSAGLLLALVTAIVFQLSKGVEHALMPMALLLRSVPLIAFAPVIIMIFGRDFWTTAVMGGIVVLFPALVSIAFGLKSFSPQMSDLVTVYGGNAWTSLRKVGLPSSLPSFFAAVRISVPGAITGALLAEWLATGRGVGGAIGGYLAAAQFSAVWAAVVVVTGVSLVLYNLVQIVENVVLARMSMHPDRRA
ncbi:ABC transporter permease [Demequina aurantiaca]|uniref:ABC transporter permease n=1 Tax=Demequina aurantiaca TaxID=676200 RepID=UPI003D347BA8